MTPVYAVIARTSAIDVAVLDRPTADLGVALRLFAAGALLSTRAVALYVSVGDANGSVLRAEGGRWRVELPEALAQLTPGARQPGRRGIPEPAGQTGQPALTAAVGFGAEGR